jgi:twitching motility two-component system response regulator PilH
MAIKKVLVVDDSATDLENLVGICSNAGYVVSTATSGTEALDKLKNEVPDAVLLDVVMPGMNGFQTCRAITSDPATQHIPVVLVSSKGEKTDRVWGEEQGAKSYVTKPFTAEQILDQLKTL